jgi:hypothetical protein
MRSPAKCGAGTPIICASMAKLGALGCCRGERKWICRSGTRGCSCVGAIDDDGWRGIKASESAIRQKFGPFGLKPRNFFDFFASLAAEHGAIGMSSLSAFVQTTAFICANFVSFLGTCISNQSFILNNHLSIWPLFNTHFSAGTAMNRRSGKRSISSKFGCTLPFESGHR